MTERYIHIPNWGRFQHYKDRNPGWIKTYTWLMSDDDYLALSFRHRGILLGLWLEYARGDTRTRGEVATKSPPGLVEVTSKLSRRLGERVMKRDLESLNHAGFIVISSSRRLPLDAISASPEEETETEELQRGVSATKYEARPVEETPYLNNIAGDIGTRIASLEQARERRTA